MRRSWRSNPYDGYRVVMGLGTFFILCGGMTVLGGLMTSNAVQAVKTALIIGIGIGILISGAYTTAFAFWHRKGLKEKQPS